MTLLAVNARVVALRIILIAGKKTQGVPYLAVPTCKPTMLKSRLRESSQTIQGRETVRMMFIFYPEEGCSMGLTLKPS